MKSRQHRSGFSTVQVLLIVVVLAILGFTGYFVYQSQKNTNKTLSSTNKVAQSNSVPKTKAQPITSFDECKRTPGSKILETYPQQCVSTNGETFTDTSGKVTPPAVTKASADSSTPAAGTCETAKSSAVTLTLTEGVPDPRCSQVTASQTLTVINPTSQTVVATLGEQSVTIPAGKSGSIDSPFGGYLQTGDHVVKTQPALYGGSGPEIYLPAN